MKITIITVFNSHNFGSFLQARQLSKMLNSKGKICFYNANLRNNFLAFLKNVKRTILRREKLLDILKGPYFEFLEWRNISRCWGTLQRTSDLSQADIVILGSDEIWNITREECRYPVFWGAGVGAKKVAYAPSVNIASKQNFQECSEYIEYMRDVDCISVRDTYSKQVVEELTGKQVELVLDPTLLSDAEHISFTYSRPYIAVYLFEGTLPQGSREEIIHFAKTQKMALVSAGRYLSWCDYNAHSVKGNPFYIFENAEYVITNTFHGTAYAINYKTRFAAIVKGKKKVEEMLEQFNLTDRIISDISKLDKILETDIDYEEINKCLNFYRENSFNYIDKSLEKYYDSKNYK